MAWTWTATVALCVAVAVVCGGVLPDPHELVKDEPKLSKFLSCLAGKDTCESWTEEVKRYIPSALKESCKDCPAEHKNFYRVVTIHLRKHRPDVYKALLPLYDKDGIYEKKFLDFIHGSN